jgi:hypothetical protein
MADAEAGEHLYKEGAAASGANNADLHPTQTVLPQVAEQPGMSIEHWMSGWDAFRGARVEVTQIRPDNDGMVNGEPASRPVPDVSCDCFLGKHKRPSRAAGDVEKGRVAPLVGLQVDP